MAALRLCLTMPLQLRRAGQSRLRPTAGPRVTQAWRRSVADGLSPAELWVLRLSRPGDEPRHRQTSFLSREDRESRPHILSKTNCTNRTEAANYARRYHLADAETI